MIVVRTQGLRSGEVDEEVPPRAEEAEGQAEGHGEAAWRVSVSVKQYNEDSVC